MFYPGDPIEQRKKALIARLARGRGGSGAGGMKVGRAPGFFGRGMTQGFSGQAIGRAIAPGLQGNPHAGGMFSPPAAPQAQAPAAPQFNMGGDMMGPGDFGQHPAGPIPSFPTQYLQVQPSIIQLLQQQLANYGGGPTMAPPPPGTYY